MKTLLCRLLVLGLVLCWQIGQLCAAPLAEGDPIPPIVTKDQHGVAYTFTNGTAFLLIATEMDSAKAANRKLAEQGAGFLEKHGAAYLMDIHPMPRIARGFALRKMRRYPQRIVLIEKEGVLDWVPVKPGQVTVLSLTPAGRVKKIGYWQVEKEPLAGLFP